MMVMTDDDEVVTMVVVVTMVMVRMVMGGADVDGGHADSDDGDNGKVKNKYPPFTAPERYNHPKERGQLKHRDPGGPGV